MVDTVAPSSVHRSVVRRSPFGRMRAKTISRPPWQEMGSGPATLLGVATLELVGLEPPHAVTKKKPKKQTRKTPRMRDDLT
jgi:hypothetical protein